jgi:hypothetical protein
MFCLLSNQNQKKKKNNRVNRYHLTMKENKWTNEVLKQVVDVAQNGKTPLKNVNIH